MRQVEIVIHCQISAIDDDIGLVRGGTVRVATVLMFHTHRDHIEGKRRIEP